MLSHFSHVQLFIVLWTIAHQAPLSIGFSWQEYFSGSPCPPLGDLPNPGTESVSLKSPTLASGFFFFYHWRHLGSPKHVTNALNKKIYKTNSLFPEQNNLGNSFRSQPWKLKRYDQAKFDKNMQSSIVKGHRTSLMG